MNAKDLSDDALAGVHALVVAAEDLDSISKRDARLIDRYLAKSRPVIVIGSGSSSALALLGISGADVAVNGDGTDVGTPAGGPKAAGAWKLAEGGTAARTWEFTDASTLESRILAAVAAWLADGGVDGSKFDKRQSSGSSTATFQTNPPAWDLRHVASYCYEKNPQGEICYGAEFYRLLNDGSSTYEWYDVLFDTMTRPGVVLWGNNWHTNRMWASSNVQYYRPHELVDYGPGSQNGVEVVSYQIGPTSGIDGAAVTAKISDSYLLTSVTVSQESSKLYDDFYVRHDILRGTQLAGVSYTTEPGATIRTDANVCLKISFQNKAEWRAYNVGSSDSFYQTWINSWREVC